MPATVLDRALGRIEAAGNRLPHPVMLFLWLALIMLAVSWVGAAAGLEATLPGSTEPIEARSLLSRDGVHWMLTHTVTNFAAFAPVGTVLVAMLGIGIAEHAGLLRAALRVLVLAAPRSLLTFAVVLAAMLSHTAADAGYVVLIPLAGILFAIAGRPPLAGLFAAFAGVSGGYSANLVIGPIDAILAGLSSEGAHLVAPAYSVNAAANYYFSLASAGLLSVVATLVSERLIEPRLIDAGHRAAEEEAAENQPLTADERRGLTAVGLWTVLLGALLTAGLWEPDGLLRATDSAALIDAPVLSGIVTLIAFYAAIAGVIYGLVSGSYTRVSDAVAGMESHMAAMASYLVLMFFAAQFVNYFAWSQLGTILAVHGADWLRTLGTGALGLMLGLIVLSALINLLVGSASAKWALLAPVFVPMFYLLGLSPEATQMAFRIGDSSTNIITPLMPYFGVVVAFAQRYDRSLGIGTLIANMLPYSLAFLLAWSLLLSLWVTLGWPLGPGAPVLLPGS